MGSNLMDVEIIKEKYHRKRFQHDINSAWEDFLTQGDCRASSVRSIVKSSWQRSQEFGVEPLTAPPHPALTDGELDQITHDHQEVLEAIQPVQDHLSDILEETKSIMLFSDSSGVLVQSFGNKKLLKASKSVLISPGHSWSESHRGTNAVGTAIELRKPVEIHAAEHFCEWVKAWSCSAAPITDLFDGTLLGVIDVTTLSQDFNTRNIAIAVTTARQIASKIHSNDLAHHLSLNNWYHENQHKWRQELVVLVDHKGRVIRISDTKPSLNQPTATLDIGTRVTDRSGQLTTKAIESQLPEELTLSSVIPQSNDSVWQGGALILKALDCKRSTASTVRPREKGFKNSSTNGFDRIVCSHPLLKETIAQAKQFAKSPAPVLLLGESGTGKELFASAIHDTSELSTGPFLPVNCGALTGDLAASELFGYESGAFTGAHAKGKVGKFEQANGGTIFLDEVGELPVDVQVMLLRVLQDGIVSRIGSNKPRQVSTRIIAATNRELGEEVNAGRFRKDLFYRLNILTLSLPALRTQPAGILALAEHFLNEFASTYGGPRKTLSNSLKDCLIAHDWPGNARELRGVLERIYVLSDTDDLTSDLLPKELLKNSSTLPLNSSHATGTVGGALVELEKSAILEEVTRQNGNLSKVAKALGIARSTLYRKIDEYNVSRS